VVLLGLLGGGLWYGWNLTQSRYYVGATDDGTVAIFKGVPGKIAWIELSEVYQRSELHMDDLTPTAQDQVRRGIDANSVDEARNKLNALSDPNNRSLKPKCPSAHTSTTPSAPPSPPSASAGASATPSVTTSPTGNPSGPDGVPASSSPTP